jgi:hypothetical protein
MKMVNYQDGMSLFNTFLIKTKNALQSSKAFFYIVFKTISL